MFIKKLFGGGSGPEVDRSFWRDFEAKVHSSSVTGDEKPKSMFDAAFVLFGEKKTQPFAHEMILQSVNPKDEMYIFPISEKLNPVYDVQKDKVVFDFALEEKLHLLIEFPVENENYDVPAQFREILGKLIFQTINHKPIKACPEPEKEVARFIKAKSEPKIERPKIAEGWGEAMAGLEKKSEAILAGVGRFTSLNPQQKEEPPVVIFETAIIAVMRTGAFVSELQVLNEKLEAQYRKEIVEELYFYTDASRNSLTWVDMKNGKVVCFNFTLFEGDVQRLKSVINTCVLQQQKKQDIESLAKDGGDWEKYYATESETSEKDEARIQSFTKNRVEIGINDELPPLVKKQKEVPADETSKGDQSPKLGKISKFAQGKATDMVYVGREGGLEMYRFKRGDGDVNVLEEVGVLPEKLTARSLVPVERDTKLVALDAADDHRISFIDPEKGKIVAEWKPAAKLNDIALYEGKFQSKSDAANFFALGDHDILNVDPRTKEGVVNKHSYKSDYGFKKILGAGKDHFAIGSANGDIRMYQKLGENAKNLIPSLVQSEVVGLDCSRDGSLLLVAHTTHLLLVPTFHHDHSAFEFTFKKDEKPAPLVLKISPQAMARYGIEKIHFTAAHFDEKEKTEESYIVATTGEYMVLWSLARVMHGQLVSSNLKKMSKSLVGGEFKYNSNDLVGAFEDCLFIQPTQERSAN